MLRSLLVGGCAAAGLLAAAFYHFSPQQRLERGVHAYAARYDPESVALIGALAINETYSALLIQVNDSLIETAIANTKTGHVTGVYALEHPSQEFGIGSSWGTTIHNTRDDSSLELSLISGYSNFDGFDGIEISWNCQQPASMPLIEGQFFLFVREGHDHRRCNDIWLINGAGERVRLLQEQTTRKWRLDPRATGEFDGLSSTDQLRELIAVLRPGDLGRVQDLIAQGADINVVDDTGFTVLLKALLNSDVRMAAFLVEEGADVNHIGPYGTLHLAIASAPSLVGEMLRRGADPRLGDQHGYAPLLEAAASGNVDVAMLLIDAGAELSSRDQLGRDVLYMPVFMGHLEMVAFLLGEGALAHRDPALLGLAASRGRLDIMDLLLEAGAQLDGQDSQRKTALHRTLDRGQPDVLSWLVERGAALELQDEDGHTALSLAILRDELESAQLLIEAGAFVNVADRDGQSPLHFAARHRNSALVPLLLAQPVDVNAQDANGNTALHVAANAERSDAVRALIAEGANVNLANTEQETPLSLAVVRRQAEIVEILISAGANPEIGLIGSQPLLQFAEEYRPKIYPILFHENGE